MTRLWCRFYKLKYDASSIQGVNYIVATMGYNYWIHIGIMIYPMYATNLLHCVIATTPIAREFWKKNYALAMIHEDVATYNMHMHKW
jgi:hypothetical protein